MLSGQKDMPEGAQHQAHLENLAGRLKEHPSIVLLAFLGLLVYIID
jgi:hypothetical protein